MTNNSSPDRNVWITGIGLVSSLGADAPAHWAALGGGGTSPAITPVVEETRFAPWPCHPLCEVEFSRQIPKRGDLRQMGRWQQIGVYAAGLALEDAGIKGNDELLALTDLVVAAGNGERDSAADRKILEHLAAAATGGASIEASGGSGLNEILLNTLRPTLYLAELSNLLAGNISIVHGVTGSSRTYKGEEMAGVSAVADAVRRIAGGQSELILVGGACNGERADQMLTFELTRRAWRGPYVPVSARGRESGGLIAGSGGAFLVLESAIHAKARGARAYAKIAGIHEHADGYCDNAKTDPITDLLSCHGASGDAAPVLAILSGATGAAPSTGHELDWLAGLTRQGYNCCSRIYASALGATVEAHFPMGIALAALAAKAGQFYPPLDPSDRPAPTELRTDTIIVSGRGQSAGTALATGYAVVAAPEPE